MSQGHEMKQSGAGGNWGCSQTQINKLSALEDRAGAGPRDSFNFFTPESKQSSVWEEDPQKPPLEGEVHAGLADAVALKEFVSKTSSVGVSCLSPSTPSVAVPCP